MSNIRWVKYNEADFRKAVEESNSIAQVLSKLGLKPHGGNYWSAKKKIKNLQISTEHFVGQSHLKGKTHDWAKKIPLEEIMVEYSEYSTGELKRRLLKENILQNKCDWCSISDWRGKKIQCELDHINGKKYDHRRENLRMLCPNCHSQTETFRGRKNKIQTKKIQPPRLHKRKVVRPSKEQLEKEVKDLGFSGTGKKYGVSDNAIRKWMKSRT